ncbi:hypothetical protein Clow_00841 [Corynebacterium lowii]|uniref:Uncharacterized protein n=1 Tax=Corynebacterium lowii TaxID=1544413 RepID=A0A0Q0ZA31_9CORY|nr:hypothetical protein Clow_00841 [Corynebacterium lowii]MDP9851317.1 hypothetical protein [Corynebacterium lowii]
MSLRGDTTEGADDLSFCHGVATLYLGVDWLIGGADSLDVVDGDNRASCHHAHEGHGSGPCGVNGIARRSGEVYSAMPGEPVVLWRLIGVTHYSGVCVMGGGRDPGAGGWGVKQQPDCAEGHTEGYGDGQAVVRHNA